ncbi:uncharacterized protein LOC130649184 [Hydractinia symbiolongicarpus]|uniref:uncharacterized protein LOC130649184 n=1 Tax=Hydractinia symbiolongicarpus TaxID=13093 RepID=UPI00254FAD9C|nr:uncharacterized protein LOC130649184 [Hydractinia symbiolongicarpus]
MLCRWLLLTHVVVSTGKYVVFLKLEEDMFIRKSLLFRNSNHNYLLTTVYIGVSNLKVIYGKNRARGEKMNNSAMFKLIILLAVILLQLDLLTSKNVDTEASNGEYQQDMENAVDDNIPEEFVEEIAYENNDPIYRRHQRRRRRPRLQVYRRRQKYYSFRRRRN